MTYRGHVRSGQIVLDESVALPEGAEVNVEVVKAAERSPEDLSAVLLRHAGKGRDLPADLATNHDHYAHGKPKI
ncbi:MAG: hypothetical protein U0805_10875 [Pirellulales bacterium]